VSRVFMRVLILLTRERTLVHDGVMLSDTPLKYRSSFIES
jgi:hypothetical protein